MYEYDHHLKPTAEYWNDLMEQHRLQKVALERIADILERFYAKINEE